MTELTTPSKTDLALSRAFDAPRERVFAAFTTPAVLLKWFWGPDPWRLAVCETDFQPGGALRYVWRHPEQGDMGLRGRVREVKAPERIVHTELYDVDWTGGETTVTTEWREEGAGTRVRITVRFKTEEARDGALQAPITEGTEQSYRRLDAILAQP